MLGMIGFVVFQKIVTLDLANRADILVLLVLGLGAWIALTKYILNLARRCNPHAKYWNKMVFRFLYAVSFLAAYVVKNYFSALIQQAQHTAAFSAATAFVLIVVALFVIIPFMIYFEELHGITALGIEPEIAEHQD